jgi:hypothetical protein
MYWLLVGLFAAAVTAAVAGALFLASSLVFGLIDLIFYMHINESIVGFYNSKIEPIRIQTFDWISNYATVEWVAFLQWCDRTGIAALGKRFGDFISLVMTEFMRFVVLFTLFTLAGLASYRLRVSRRVTYGIFELIVALVAINGMAGGNFALGYIIALLSGLYVMIRGLQNVDDGLKAYAAGGGADTNGAIRTAYDLFQALFYSSLKQDDWQRIGTATVALIRDAWAGLRAVRIWRRSASQRLTMSGSPEAAMIPGQLESEASAPPSAAPPV